MKILYVDCGMGAAGDMLTAALLELFPDPGAVLAELNDMGLEGVSFRAEHSVKCGITGTHMSVTVNGEEEASMGGEASQNEGERRYNHDNQEHHHHHHYGLHDHHEHHHHASMDEIEHIVREQMNLPQKVREDVLAVYRLIAEAESRVHGVPVAEIHFHEVGAKDAIADIAAVCLLMEKLSPDRVVASPVHVGSGRVRCAHGTLPVPAPATALLLQGIPIYGDSIDGELCTPTGAALLKHFVTEFGGMPVMELKACGYGMGRKDFEAANCVRVMLGEDGESLGPICELSCNVDDMTGESMGFAMERLLEAGALDVYVIPVQMKKSRPGMLLQVICKPADRDRMVGEIMKHTTTIGVRENRLWRHTLDREIEPRETSFGRVRRKVSRGYDVERAKYEYEDLARIARERGLSLEQVRALLCRVPGGE